MCVFFFVVVSWEGGEASGFQKARKERKVAIALLIL